jgi:hypothetical protein
MDFSKTSTEELLEELLMRDDSNIHEVSSLSERDYGQYQDAYSTKIIDGPGIIFFLAHGQRYCVRSIDPIYGNTGRCVFCGGKPEV